MTTTPLRECDKCEGTGWTPSAKVTGREMRALREGRGMSGAEVARAMEPSISRAYLQQLEIGKRRWTVALVERYLKALDRATAEAQR
jgi:transcriptional regulator with XRE-family HTH domain